MKLNIFVVLALSTGVLTFAAPLPKPGPPGWSALKKLAGKAKEPKHPKIPYYAPEYKPQPGFEQYGNHNPFPQPRTSHREETSNSVHSSPKESPEHSPEASPQHPLGTAPSHHAVPKSSEPYVPMTHEYPREYSPHPAAPRWENPPNQHAPSPYGQPAYGQPAYGQPAYGQPAYGQPHYGGQPVYGAGSSYPAQNAYQPHYGGQPGYSAGTSSHPSGSEQGHYNPYDHSWLSLKAAEEHNEKMKAAHANDRVGFGW